MSSGLLAKRSLYNESSHGRDTLPDEATSQRRRRNGSACILAYNLTRVMNILGKQALIAAIRMA
jgi:hypothetical protein